MTAKGRVICHIWKKADKGEWVTKLGIFVGVLCG